MLASRQAALNTLILLCCAALPFAAAHGGGEHGESATMDMGMNMGAAPTSTAAVKHFNGDDDPETFAQHQLISYFRYTEYSGWLTTHTWLMLLAWTVLMPLAIMLSIARSRYHLPAQVIFHIINGVAIFTGIVYNHSTPDLYENNAHHPIGWVLVGLTVAWTVMSMYMAYGEYQNHKRASLSQTRIAQHDDRFAQYNDLSPTRTSRDSGQGTERNSASLFGSRQNSSDSVYQKPEQSKEEAEDVDLEDEMGDADSERKGFLGNNSVDRFISKSVQRFSSQRAAMAVRFLQIVLEKFLLLLGFTAILTGFITSGGIFRHRQVFSGAAHFVKGGIFFWYGLLTLGRWMGAFTEFGWGWNIRPRYPVVAKWKTWIPSAEFTESFVIWLYGASNVFLEHLNSNGTGWSPSDLEHVSITILFFGGGLLGMLIESSWVRMLLNTTSAVQQSADDHLSGTSHFPAPITIPTASLSTSTTPWSTPSTYRFSLNPMPALTIMLLGMMMSGHHQASMVSTMMHAQWGGLFSAFALARAATYIIMYLKPPTSHYPARPPTELVTAFCLTSGGILFMMSASDGIWTIESNGLDAMTMFTLTMGLTGVVLAWEVIVFAIKGWAVRRERLAKGRPLVAAGSA